jgi:hypothetical protein
MFAQELSKGIRTLILIIQNQYDPLRGSKLEHRDRILARFVISHPFARDSHPFGHTPITMDLAQYPREIVGCRPYHRHRNHASLVELNKRALTSFPRIRRKGSGHAMVVESDLAHSAKWQKFSDLNYREAASIFLKFNVRTSF